MKIFLSAEKMLQAGPIGPVVMCTCIDKEGKTNIITLGMYMPISSTPPLICIGISPQRYSHDIIVESGEFVINVPSIDLVKEMHFCGTKSGRDFDKFAETRLTPMPATTVKPPLIRECFGHLECEVVATYVCGDHTLFVGKVKTARVNEDVLIGGNLNPLKANPIAHKNHIYYTVKNGKNG